MERLITEDADRDADPDPDLDPEDRAADADSDADECHPARSPLYVPVRLGSCGGQQLRFARTPLGARTAIGFTSARRLTAVLGEQQSWIRLAEPVLRALAAPLGAAIVTVDPQLTAPAPVPAPAPRAVPASACARHALELPEAMTV
ncbi:SAV_915 family protein [Streptomyces lushanensis]|uniref:SAV_915 family protein n=1 Tax=Streptomyces lushanensis TaxID=1434255 RepID=UPI001FE10EC5|nr:SAV_915 family protein [Streptomyces lushanensis]